MYTIIKTILDAIFPFSREDKKVLAFSPEEALLSLPPAPKTPIENCFSVFAYKNPLVTKLIWNIKYKKSAQAIKIGGYALYKQLIELDEKYFDKLGSYSNIIIIPIPITNRRRNERGYNQCELLLNEIEKLDTKKRLILKKDLLERIHHQDRQTLKNRDERLESAKDIFAVNEIVASELKNQISNVNVIKNTPDSEPIFVIIDDVITTGSTIKEAMETLRKAGFSKIYGLSLAH